MTSLPTSMRKLVVKTLTSNFREAIEVHSCALPKLEEKHVLIRNLAVGVNASDVNYSAGKYSPGTLPPFDAGFEAVGEVVAVGGKVSSSLIGQAVCHMTYGAFSEYQATSEKNLFPIKSPNPHYLPCLVSGMTAKLAFDNNGNLKPTDKVLVTAAAGGTGQFAVQLAKLAGCHVIGTCSSQKKVEFLKSIGCDHPVNISEQDLNTVLKQSYPEGIDVIYESVGGKTYETCVNRLAVKGRLIVIGYISGYQDAMGVGSSKFARAAAALPVKLLMKSAKVGGFFLFHYAPQWREAFEALRKLYDEGKIQCVIDEGRSIKEGGFKGIDDIVNAVEYLYTKKSIGKVVVSLDDLNQFSKL